MSEYSASPYDHNPYALPESLRDELTEKLLREQPPVGTDKVVCYKIDGSDPLSDIGRSIECEVFHDVFGDSNDADHLLVEYGKFEANSIFFLAIDKDEQKARGVLRVIVNANDQLEDFKTLSDLDPHSREMVRDVYGIEDLSELWDIGTVAVQKQFRDKTGPVSGLLYYGMHKEAMRQNVKHFVSAINVRVYEKMRDFLGIPFEPLLDMPPKEYMGTMSQFVYGNAEEFMDSVKRNRQKYIFVEEILEAIDPLVGKADSALQF